MAGFFASVLLDQPEVPNAAAIAGAIRRRHPGVHAEPGLPPSNLIQPGEDVQIICVGDRSVIVSLIRRRARVNPLVWRRALPTWPNILDVAQSHQAHLLVSTMGSEPREPLTHARTITATVGSILDLLPGASTVIWAGLVARDPAIWRKDSLTAFAPSPAFPLLLWIDILARQDFHRNVVSTDGLMIFSKSDFKITDEPSRRTELLRTYARRAAQAIALNDTSPIFSTRDDAAAELIQFDDELSNRIDALARLQPAPLGPLPRLRRAKGPRGRQKPPAIYEIAARYAEKALNAEFENIDVLLAGARVLRPPDGARGFPPYAEIPRIVIGKGRDKGQPRDLEEYHAYWLISDRLKAVFEAIDSDAFAFQRCDVRQHDGSAGPQLWLCDVVRTLDAIDEDTAKVIDHYFERGGGRRSNFVGYEDLCFDQRKIRDAHIFRIPYCPGVFCDQRLKDACRTSGLKVRFEPTFE